MAEIKEESQQELFREFSGEALRSERFPSIPKAQKPILLTTSTEQLILAGILLILSFCLVFFLGLLRGKALVQSPAVASAGLPPATVQAYRASAPAAAPKKTELPPASAVSAAKPYTIVLATYKKQAQAEREATALKRLNQPAFVTGSGEYFVVCVGHYANIAEAKKDLKFFGAKYKGAYLKRR